MWAAMGAIYKLANACWPKVTPLARDWDVLAAFQTCVASVLSLAQPPLAVRVVGVMWPAVRCVPIHPTRE